MIPEQLLLKALRKISTSHFFLPATLPLCHCDFLQSFLCLYLHGTRQSEHRYDLSITATWSTAIKLTLNSFTSLLDLGSNLGGLRPWLWHHVRRRHLVVIAVPLFSIQSWLQICALSPHGKLERKLGAFSFTQSWLHVIQVRSQVASLHIRLGFTLSHLRPIQVFSR